MTTSRIRATPIALALWALAIHAGAQPAAGEVLHRVRPGDTLEALSIHYLGTPSLWPQLQSLNNVADPLRLMPGTVLRIPSAPGLAQVGFVQGDASVTQPGAAGSEPLKEGAPLAEGARVAVGPGSFVNVRLLDGTVIRVQADTQVQLQQLRRVGRAGNAQSVIDLQRGSVESSVPPSRNGARHYEIRTPVASTSVRGTRFAVTLTDDGRTLAAVTEGALAVQQRAASQKTRATPVPTGQGVRVAANGQVGTPAPLLPAPDLAALPATLEDARFLTLALAPVPGASGYQVQLARDTEQSEVLRSGTFDTPQVRLPALDDGSYHLAVRALDAEGIPGLIAQRPITIKAQPVPPLYQAPPVEGIVSRTQGRLLCTQVSGVARYRIQVAADAGFAAPLIDDAQALECGAAVSTLAPGRYFWRTASIRQLPGGGMDQGPFALPQPFAVADNPKALDPATLQWDDSRQLRWPGEPGQRFRLQIAQAEDFAALVADERLASPAWSSAALAPGLYYVRIQVQDPSGLESGFSTPHQILVQAPVMTQWGQTVTSSDGRPLVLH